jgi:hypothetical protein
MHALNKHFLGTSFPWIGSFEYLIQFFQGSAFGLDKEKINECSFEEIPKPICEPLANVK